MSRNEVSNYDQKVIYKNQGSYEPKDEDQIFMKNDDNDIRSWNKRTDIKRGNLIVKLQFDLPRKLSDKQKQILKAIYK